jgi:hypothetical protein
MQELGQKPPSLSSSMTEIGNSMCFQVLLPCCQNEAPCYFSVREMIGYLYIFDSLTRRFEP